MHIEVLESFPPSTPELKQNPFWHDAYHMGTYLGGSSNDTDVCIMFSRHEHNQYIIVVDCVTGERIRVTFKR